MKIGVFTFLLLISAIAFAGILPGKSLPSSKHEFMNSYPQDDLPAGICKVSGHVYNGLSNYTPIAGVLVSSLNRTASCTTDSTGYYEFLMSAKDTAIFAYKSQFSEHVIWKFEFTEYYIFEIDFYLVEDYGMIEVDKPVIYLYSEEELSVNVKFNPVGELTFAYPKYASNEGWDVKVSRTGLLQNGRSYPYLFWESETKNLDYADDDGKVYGQFIATDTAVQFLENTLTTLGLNSGEQTDFITFWMPRLIYQKYAFVQFILDDTYDQKISEMTVIPPPENMRRVFMLFTGYDSPQQGDFKNQELSGFERSGFTLIEWGGAKKPTCKVFDYEVVSK